MARSKPRVIEVSTEKLREALRRAESALPAEDVQLFKDVADSYDYLAELIGDKNTSIRRLRKLLFGARTEKTSDVAGQTNDQSNTSKPDAGDEAESGKEEESDEALKSRPPPPGHGRNGADDYVGGERVNVSHESLQPGDACPDCWRGTLYERNRPAKLVRLVGQAPVRATVYHLQKLRCNLCGKTFTAAAPEGVGDQKYDATVASMIALLKYGSGFPFNRQAGLQGGLGVPLPASTQWEIIAKAYPSVKPAYEELIRQAACGDVLYNDDTIVRILAMMGKRADASSSTNAQGKPEEEERPRKGLFTTGIVSTGAGRRIALFFSGRQHAGENLSDVLAQRAQELGPPIQMCDALSRNLPVELETIVANCLAHGRRQFVDVADRFPEPCLHVLEALKVVYHNDALAREQDLSPGARLEFHQAQSGPVMAELRVWLDRQFEERRVEPNSSLGQAIAYLTRHWHKLTLFLRVPGAPLDNNVCERALKKAILHRKNSLFYKTAKGAAVGDAMMSLIHTCQLNDANPFDYLTALQRNAVAVAANPGAWMPWNHLQTSQRREN